MRTFPLPQSTAAARQSFLCRWGAQQGRRLFVYVFRNKPSQRGGRNTGCLPALAPPRAAHIPNLRLAPRFSGSPCTLKVGGPKSCRARTTARRRIVAVEVRRGRLAVGRGCGQRLHEPVVSETHAWRPPQELRAATLAAAAWARRTQGEEGWARVARARPTPACSALNVSYLGQAIRYSNAVTRSTTAP